MKVDRLIGTDFLVDRWRNGEASAASIYARLHTEDSRAIPWIVKGEFLSFTVIDGKASPQLLELLAALSDALARRRASRRLRPARMRCSGGKAFLFATKTFGLPFPRCDLTFP